jgi:thiamine kinase-like enzyme
MISRFTHLLTALSSFFDGEEIHSTSLKGGFSSAQNYLLEVKGEKYVLRVFNERRDAELTAAIAAAEQGISPAIYWIAGDRTAYLMKYIEHGSFSIRLAKMEKNIGIIARSFQKIHTLNHEGIPHRSLFKQLVEKYENLKNSGFTSPLSDRALDEITKRYQELVPNQRAYVVIHGDSTPRNEFFTGDAVIIIDWDEANLENLFYDLSLFALLHNYTQHEEEIFLTEYFNKPASHFWDEYQLFKKINLVRCFTDSVSFAHHLDPDKKFIRKPTSWSSCIDRFENPNDPLSPQFFYDLGMAAIDQFFVN